MTQTADFLPTTPQEGGEEAEIAKELASLRARAEALKRGMQGQPWAQVEELPQEAPCPQCQGAGFFRREVPVGHPDFGRPIPCSHPSHRRERALALAGLCEMTPRQRQLTLDDIQPYDEGGESNSEALAMAKAFLEEEAGAYFVYGPPGNGKTDIICALVNEIERLTGIRGIYLSLQGLLEFIEAAWAEKQAYDTSDERAALAHWGKLARWEAITKLPVIAVDEFDIDPQKLNASGWVRETLWRFVYTRHQLEEEGAARTILSSNNAPDDFLPAIRSRIRHHRNFVVQNTAPDMRSMPL